MVVLGGGAVSYERGTPVVNRRGTLPGPVIVLVEPMRGGYSQDVVTRKIWSQRPCGTNARFNQPPWGREADPCFSQASVPLGLAWFRVYALELPLAFGQHPAVWV